MKFRTEIEIPKSAHRIAHDDGGVLLLGSCFSDNAGSRLEADGFEVCHNPMGPLYNPASLHKFITRLIDRCIESDSPAWNQTDLTADSDGIWHALDFPLRYSDTDPDALLRRINSECRDVADRLRKASTMIITFGTAWCFELISSGCTVGNCHKLQADIFRRRRMDIDEIVALWQPLLDRLRGMGKYIIATVSPIRHLADGLHGNQLSKATLLLAVDKLNGFEYFPAYEILADDLRDYRFYADDMKHPSDKAVDYIYEIFSTIYFSGTTREEARLRHAAFLRAAHRPLL